MTRIHALVFWVIYAAVIAALGVAVVRSGLFWALWSIDQFYLVSLCTAIYALAEGRLFLGYYSGNRQSAILDAAWFCKLLGIIAIASTMAGILIAFYPFLNMNGNVEAMQAHLGQFFAGVTVAVVPAVAGFIYWGLIEINQQILVWIEEARA
jgi:hypothetical protein